MKKVKLTFSLLYLLSLPSCTAHQGEWYFSKPLGTISSPKSFDLADPLVLSPSKDAGQPEIVDYDLDHVESDPNEGARLEKVVKADVVRMLIDYGFPREFVPKMVCTAQHESNFSAFAVNLNRNGTMDTGLFQINDIWLTTCNVTREDLLDPEENTRCAHTVFKKQGIKAWMAYKKKRSICQNYKLDPSLSSIFPQLTEVSAKPKPRRS